MTPNQIRLIEAASGKLMSQVSSDSIDTVQVTDYLEASDLFFT